MKICNRKYLFGICFFDNINLYKVIFHQKELEITDFLYVLKLDEEFLYKLLRYMHLDCHFR